MRDYSVSVCCQCHTIKGGGSQLSATTLSQPSLPFDGLPLTPQSTPYGRAAIGWQGGRRRCCRHSLRSMAPCTHLCSTSVPPPPPPHEGCYNIHGRHHAAESMLRQASQAMFCCGTVRPSTMDRPTRASAHDSASSPGVNGVYIHAWPIRRKIMPSDKVGRPKNTHFGV